MPSFPRGLPHPWKPRRAVNTWAAKIFVCISWRLSLRTRPWPTRSSQLRCNDRIRPLHARHARFALALAQANKARRRLAEAQGFEIERIALKVIRTSGNRIQDRPLAEAGGKGLFTKEIDAALIAGEIDAAVHSAKDLPSRPPDGIALAAALAREDVRDALVSIFADTVEGLPKGATFGAASLRRQAQALSLGRTCSRNSCAATSDPARQSRIGSGRRDSARACGLEAARPRPSRPRRARRR